jgi:hypothetical protein
MFLSKKGLKREEVNNMIQAVRQEFIQCIYGLEHKNQILEEKNKQLEQELQKTIKEYNWILHNHFMDIELKINSFMKVWNPIVTDNFTKVKEEVIKETSEQVNEAIKSISLQNNMWKIKDEVLKETNEKINLLITQNNYNENKKMENLTLETTDKICQFENLLNKIDVPVCLGYYTTTTQYFPNFNPVFVSANFQHVNININRVDELIKKIVPSHCDFYFELTSLSKLLWNNILHLDKLLNPPIGSYISVMINGQIIGRWDSKSNFSSNDKINNIEEVKKIKEYCDAYNITLLNNGKKISNCDLE